jgi:hypothetical protein
VGPHSSERGILASSRRRYHWGTPPSTTILRSPTSSTQCSLGTQGHNPLSCLPYYNTMGISGGLTAPVFAAVPKDQESSKKVYSRHVTKGRHARIANEFPRALHPISLGSMKSLSYQSLLRGVVGPPTVPSPRSRGSPLFSTPISNVTVGIALLFRFHPRFPIV